jgi:UDP-N-acetylmuramoyl-tripeptide--D-alanyl-D-alanine ligase
MLRLSSLAPLLNARLVGADKSFVSLSTDSRSLRAGELFVALRGEHFDGHQFLRQAIANGATAVVVDTEQNDIAASQIVVADTCLALGQIAAYNRSLFKGTVIGVTGSSGKTSVKGMLRDILAVAHDVVATPGNFNNQIGVPLSLMQLNQQSHAVIEMGTNHPGEIAYLTDLVLPDVALVNNVMPAHIGGFGTLAAIAEEKSAIYRRLLANQTAVINVDDEFRPLFEAATENAKRMGFSVTDTVTDYPTLRARNIDLSSTSGAAFTLMLDQQVVQVQLMVPGLHSVKNALASAACTYSAGCTFAEIAEGLASFSGVAGRMQRNLGVNDASVIDDTYNANPGSVRAAVDYLSSCAGQRILVLGDLGELGDSAEQAHYDLGVYARQQHIDAVFACGQFAQNTIDGFGAAGPVFATKQAIAEMLLPLMNKNTTVLVKGSRSSRMEDVVEIICRREAIPSC